MFFSFVQWTEYFIRWKMKWSIQLGYTPRWMDHFIFHLMKYSVHCTNEQNIHYLFYITPKHRSRSLSFDDWRFMNLETREKGRAVRQCRTWFRMYTRAANGNVGERAMEQNVWIQDCTVNGSKFHDDDVIVQWSKWRISNSQSNDRDLSRCHIIVNEW